MFSQILTVKNGNPMGPVASEKSLFSQEYAGTLTYWSQGKVNHLDEAILTHWPLRDLNKIIDKLMPLDLTYDKSTLVQIMAWCLDFPCHVASHNKLGYWPNKAEVSSPVWLSQQVNSILIQTELLHASVHVRWSSCIKQKTAGTLSYIIETLVDISNRT